MMATTNLINIVLLFVPVTGSFTFQASVRGAQSRELYTAPSDFVCLDYKLDFNDATDNLSPGDYITNELQARWAVSIFAENPRTSNQVYTPGGAVRIFDTSNPGTNNDNGDPDLGTPNENCPNRGPGKGSGGGPNAPHPNCEPLGNVVIIQETNKIYPDDSAKGGDIYFTFDYPVTLMTLGLLDIEESSRATLTAYYYNNASPPHTWVSDDSGDNGFYSYPILNQKNVIKFKVSFPGSGALAHIEYRTCRPEGDVRNAGFDFSVAKTATLIPDDSDECPEDL